MSIGRIPREHQGTEKALKTGLFLFLYTNPYTIFNKKIPSGRAKAVGGVVLLIRQFCCPLFQKGFQFFGDFFHRQPAERHIFEN